MVDTDMTPAEVTEIIDRIDQYIILKVDTGTVNALILEDISATWSAYRVMLKDPDARRIGAAYGENRATSLKLLWAQIQQAIKDAGGVATVIQQDPLT